MPAGAPGVWLIAAMTLPAPGSVPLMVDNPCARRPLELKVRGKPDEHGFFGAVFPDLDRFDVRRENARLQVAFAHGPHVCLGMHLARLEGHTAVEQLLRRLPALRLDPSSPAAPHGLVFRKRPSCASSGPLRPPRRPPAGSSRRRRRGRQPARSSRPRAPSRSSPSWAHRPAGRGVPARDGADRRYGQDFVGQPPTP